MPLSEKINLFGKSLPELEEIALNFGERKFRGKQLYEWLYNKKVLNLEECSNLPKSFINQLNNNYMIHHPEVIKVLTDPEDGTQKYLLKLEDDKLIEAVLMNYSFGNSVCLSTQVGCAMGCTFCASGKNGKDRNLTAEEIAGQIIAIENYSGKQISNIVLMGMGEPLDNFDNVLKFIKLANQNLNIGQRHITLSTCGLVDKIKALADEKLQINLAISLHSPFQNKREEILPIAKRYNIDQLINASKEYFNKTGRRVTYEYTVIPDFNNSEADALELKKLIGNIPHHINLIPLNPVTKEVKPSRDNVKLFAEILNKQGLISTIRRKNGKNIEAACGQLRNQELEI